MTNPLINKSSFTVKVNKTGSMLQSNRPITVKNQIEEIRSLEDIPGVNVTLKEDGATIVYNANTGKYDIKPYNYDAYLNVSNLYIQHLYANNSLGSNGQVLFTNGNTIYWANGVTNIVAGTGLSGGGQGERVELSVNAAYIATITANNATFAYGKREGDLLVNFAVFSGQSNFAYDANNAAYAFGKSEDQLSVAYANVANFANIAYNAYVANNSTFAYGKRENDLLVNFAVFSGQSNFSYEANVAYFLNGLPSSYFTNATNITTGTLPPEQLPIIDCGTY